MSDEDKLALETFYDAHKMRNSGKIFLGDVEPDDKEKIQRVALIFKEELLIELTPDQIKEAAAALAYLYKKGEKLAYKSSP